MSSVVISVETDEVTVEKSKQQLVSYRQNSVDFTAGEWSVEEETNLNVFLGVSNFFSEHLR
jgi:hypothetical protein